MQLRSRHRLVAVPFHPPDSRYPRIARDIGKDLIEPLPPQQQLVHDKAQRVHVGSTVHVAAAEQFRGHVFRGAHQHRGLTRKAGRDAEVGDRGAKILPDDYVAWFQVAVNDTRRVHRRHRPGQSPQQCRGRLCRQRALQRVEHLLQCLPLDVLHDDEQPVLVLQQIVDGDNALLLAAELGQHLRLTAEMADEPGVLRQVRRNMFGRHVPVKQRIVTLVHDRLPAGADLLHDLVLADLRSRRQPQAGTFRVAVRHNTVPISQTPRMRRSVVTAGKSRLLCSRARPRWLKRKRRESSSRIRRARSPARPRRRCLSQHICGWRMEWACTGRA